MNKPEVVIVRRYRCPFCRRSGSARAAITAHMGRCWLNPAVRSCKTCFHYDYYPGAGVGDPCVPGEFCNCDAPEERCGAGIDLTDRAMPVTACPLWKLRDAA